MRKIVVALVASLLLIGLVGCGDSKETETKSDVPVEEILTAIKEKMAENLEAEYGGEDLLVDGELAGYIEGDLTEENSEDFLVNMLLEQMDLKQEELDEGVFMAPMMNINSDQIIILKAKELDNVDSLKEALERALEQQVITWEQYLPDQFEKVKQNIISSEGPYLIYITANNPESLEEIFIEKVK